MLAAATAGLAVMALVISLMFNLYGSFQRREVMVLTLDARAGAPPSGVALLETYARFGLLADLPATFAAWELWSAEILESHRAYPILPYFRSSHDNESWVSALGAVLDAATLMLTTVDAAAADEDEISSDDATLDATLMAQLNHARLLQAQGAAHMMYGLATHTVLDLSDWFDLPRGNDPGVEQMEFHLARGRLARAGFALREAEKSWHDFSELRAVYAVPLNAMAKRFATPPAQWIGDRSTVSYLHQHARRTPAS